MNELLQKHGCSNVFTIPEGLRELMADISREVLREQPVKICDFIANYLSALLITREHGIMAVKILEDLCDCRPSVSEHLINCGMPSAEAKILSEIINEEIQGAQIIEGKEKIKETEILKKILKRNPLDEEMTAKVCQIARNAYRDYWYRKKMLEQELKVHPDEPWEIAAQHTLEIYKKTKPSFTDLNRATQKIQAAYRGYHIRRQMLGHLKPKKKPAPKVDLLGPPVDIAQSREIDLGPVVDIKEKVKTDDVSKMFVEENTKVLGLDYDTTKTITDQPPGMEAEKAPSKTMSAKIVPSTLKTVESAVAESVTAPSVTSKLESSILKSETTELAELEEAADLHRISFAPQSEIETMFDVVPEDLTAADHSEGATATYDVELSSAQTASAPSTAPSTAPTSDVEDIAPSGTEGEGEEGEGEEGEEEEGE